MDNTKNTEVENGFGYFIDELLKVSKVHNILYFEYKKKQSFSFKIWCQWWL